MRIRSVYWIFGLICLLLLWGCPSKVVPPPVEHPAMKRITAAELPDLRDDMEVDSLRVGLSKSLAWYSRIPEDRPIAFGECTISAKALRESLAHFLSLLQSGFPDTETLGREFDIFRVMPQDRGGQMLVSGYYEPVLAGSLKPDGVYKWPIYGVPSDLLSIELERFDPSKFKGERLVGRLEKNAVVPYYTRAEIDGQKKLEHSGAQLAWLKDPIDCFFLQVQGSGAIRLPDGKEVRVGYAGKNGRPYRSIGKILVDSGAVSRDEMSLQAIRKYLQAHAEIRDKIMWENESYVFFKWVPEGPVGSLNTVLTPGRSVASDEKFHPRGFAAFMVSEKPRFDGSGQVVGWERFGRWVLHQDVGGAIKGPGRIDLFCGTGESAERIAGPMKQPGEMYYFLKKGIVPECGK